MYISLYNRDTGQSLNTDANDPNIYRVDIDSDGTVHIWKRGNDSILTDIHRFGTRLLADFNTGLRSAEQIIADDFAPRTVDPNRHRFESHARYFEACLHCGKGVENWRHTEVPIVDIATLAEVK